MNKTVVDCPECKEMNSCTLTSETAYTRYFVCEKCGVKPIYRRDENGVWVLWEVD